VLTFRDGGFPDPMALVRHVQERPDDYKMRPDGKLVVQGGWPEATQRLKALRAVLEALSRIAMKKAA
jgi:transcription-repair coupling factor (superfamily II helicase)